MTGGNFEFDLDDFTSQDQSEMLDETNTVGDGDRGEARSFTKAEKRRAAEARRGKDHAPDYQADEVSDADLRDLGYLSIESDAKGG